MKSTVHRAIANARERDRTESINNAFNRLRTLLPTEPAERKLSKVEILRLATSYIRHLSNIKSAKSNGLSERNVCLKSNRDFCTFCITAKKEKFELDSGESHQKPALLNADMGDGKQGMEQSSLNIPVNDDSRTMDGSSVQTTILVDHYGVAYSNTDTCDDYSTDQTSVFVTNVDAAVAWSVDGAHFVQAKMFPEASNTFN